jgi:hypothetical protein
MVFWGAQLGRVRSSTRKYVNLSYFLPEKAGHKLQVCLRRMCSGLASITGKRRRHSRYALCIAFQLFSSPVCPFFHVHTLNPAAIMSEGPSDSSNVHLEPPSKTTELQDPGAEDNCRSLGMLRVFGDI